MVQGSGSFTVVSTGKHASNAEGHKTIVYAASSFPVSVVLIITPAYSIMILKTSCFGLFETTLNSTGQRSLKGFGPSDIQPLETSRLNQLHTWRDMSQRR